MKKLDRISQIALIAAFALFLIAAMALTWRARWKTYSFYENRLLARRPAFSAEAIADGSWFTALEDYLIDHAAGHNTLAELDVRADLLLGRPVINDVVVLPDLLLPYNLSELVDEAAIEADAARMTERLVTVRDRVEANGGTFCYVAVPCQLAFYPDRYPACLNNRAAYIGLAREYLFRGLSASGVDYVDMGEVFDTLGHPEVYASTVDNHYSIFGAYETYRAMLEHLGLDPLDEEDFDVAEVPLLYLGSRTRKLLGVRVSDERLYTMTPKTPIPFTRSESGVPAAAELFDTTDSMEGQWVAYSYYMGGDKAETLIDTHRSELPSILIYGDSMTNAVECIAYASFDRMYSIDLRHCSGEKTLGDYIDELHPDYVVCIRDYESLLLTEFNGAGAD